MDMFDVQFNFGNNRTAAWPVANPVFTCASVTDVNFPSNFVADPFLYIRVSVEVIISRIRVFIIICLSESTAMVFMSLMKTFIHRGSWHKLQRLCWLAHATHATI